MEVIILGQDFVQGKKNSLLRFLRRGRGCPYPLCSGKLARIPENPNQCICEKCWEPFVMSLGRWPPKVELTEEQKKIWKLRHLPQKPAKKANKKMEPCKEHKRSERGAPLACGNPTCGRWEGNVWVFFPAINPKVVLRNMISGTPVDTRERAAIFDLVKKNEIDGLFAQIAPDVLSAYPENGAERLAQTKINLLQEVLRSQGKDPATIANAAKLAKEIEADKLKGYLLPCGHRTQALGTGGHRTVTGIVTNADRTVCFTDGRVFLAKSVDGKIEFVETSETGVTPSPRPKMFEPSDTQHKDF